MRPIIAEGNGDHAEQKQGDIACPLFPEHDDPWRDFT